MADRYLTFTGTAPGRFLTRRLGLPQPAPLHRFSPEHPRLDGPLLHLTTGGPTQRRALAAVPTGTGLKVVADTSTEAERPAAVVVDATAAAGLDSLAEVHAALHPVVRSVATGGRVVVIGTPPSPDDHHQAAVQQGLEGF